MMKKVAFLDRDGTLNLEKDYLFQWKNFEWIEGAKDFIKSLKDHGYFVAVVTNQSGIARGYYKASDVIHLHEKMNDDLKKTHDVVIDRFEICPHHPEFTGQCTCRKPDTMLLRRIVNFTGVIDKELSFMVGDNMSDYNTAENFEIKPFLVLTGHGSKHKDKVKSKVEHLSEILDLL